MNLFTIPLRYARAKWLRTVLLVAVFALGVASMTGLREVSTLVGDSFEKKLVSYGANILVTPKRETLKVSYGGYTLGDVTLEEHWIPLDFARSAVDNIPLRANIAVMAPKLIATTRLGKTGDTAKNTRDGGQPVAIVGVDWKEELAMKGYWETQGALPAVNSINEVLVGASLAQSMAVMPGQTLSIGGRDLLVSGVLLPTGGDDDTVLFAALPFVQEFTGKKDQASFIEVAALCAGCPIEDLVTQLQEALPDTEVRALRQVAESRMYAVHFAQNLAFSASVVILVTACAMIVMSMLSSVTERRKEIGIMRAVGFSRSSVFAVFVAEALVIGLLAGIIGHVAGYFLAEYVLAQLHLTDAATHPFSLLDFFLTIATVALAAGLSAAFPAWKASLVEPAESLVAL